MLIIPVWTVFLHYLSDCGLSGYGNLLIGDYLFYQLIALTLIFKGTYIINQIYDIETDRLNNKLFFLPREIISIKAAWCYYIILNTAGLLFSLYVSGQSFLVTLFIVILGIMYSAPMIRLKDNMIGGLLVNAIAYGFLIPLAIGLYCMGRMPAVSAIPYFLAIATGYILTTIPDYEGDMAAQKMTIAVVIGKNGALWLGLLTSLSTAILSYKISNFEMAIVSGVTTLLIITLLFRYNNRLVLFSCKFPILLLTVFAGIHFPLYLGFLLLTIGLTRAYYKKRFGIVYPELS